MRLLDFTARDPLQLVATVGPAFFDRAAALAQAGATGFRLNASHMTPAALAEAVAAIRSQLAPIGAMAPIPIIVDLQGAKMRLGELPPRQVADGEELVFVPSPIGDAEAVPLPHPELFAAVHPGDTLRGDDGRMRLEVIDAAADRLRARCRGGGRLRARQGVNLVEHPVLLADLTAPDQARLGAVAGVPGVAFALSFIAGGAEAAWVRRRVEGAIVVAKIERREAIDRLDEIESTFDAVWICRGDLGEQLGLGDLARFIAAFSPRGRARPTLIAGQVLEHLTRHAAPTRSEVCHLHDLLGRGYAGVVLSDETAIGDDPARAVAVAHGLLGEVAPRG